MKRRTLLQLLAGSSGGLLLGIVPTGCVSLHAKKIEEYLETEGVFRPNAFLRIHSDERIQLLVSKSEMGQGILTAFATLVAEELEVPIERIDAKQAFDLAFGSQGTGGSTSTRDSYIPIRRAAAVAREMLRSAAATEWTVDIKECTAKEGAIYHSSGQRLSYGELAALAAYQPIPKDPPLKSSAEFSVIGKGVQRVDASDKCTGVAQFGTDVSHEEKVSAYVIRPPVLGGQALRFNAEKALLEEGVLQIFSFARGVAVIAKRYWQAKRAAQLVEVVWDQGIVAGLHTDEVLRQARLRSQQEADHTPKKKGNVVDALEKKDGQTLVLQYDFPYLSHATMEPQNCTAVVYEQEARVKLWVPTQSPTMCARIAAQLLDIPLESVEVEVMMLGGGFGRRSALDFVVDALMIARDYPNVPVQVIWSREDDMGLGYYRPIGTCRMRGAIDSAGEITAIHSHLVSQSVLPDAGGFLAGMFPTSIPPKLRQKLGDASMGYLNSSVLAGFFDGGDIAGTKYDLPNFRADFTPINIRVPVGFWRSVAHSYSTFIMETFLDQLIHLGGKDPIAVRKQLLAKHPRYLRVMDETIAASSWKEPLEEGWGRGFAISEFFGSVVGQVVEAGVVDGQIAVRHVTCAVDCGLVVNPDVVRAQLESAIVYGLSMLWERIDIVDGVVQQRNFDSFPVLRMNQLPKIRTVLIPSDNHPTGIGEIALPPVNAAVSNAIFAATGKRLTNMPLQDDWNNQDGVL